MGILKVRNWDTWQSYRKDRGTPPWVKVHRNLMTKPEWAELSDAEKGQLVSIWIVAADKGGVIPSNPKLLRKICLLDVAPNINKFIELGFLEEEGSQCDASVTASGRQSDVPETETETETELNTVKQIRYSENIKSIFAYWRKTTQHPRALLDDKRKNVIRAALKIGYSVSDLKTAIDGCMRTPHNIGKNDRGQVYDGLHIILKDADQIDRFMGNAKKPPKVEQAHHQSSAYAPFKAE